MLNKIRVEDSSGPVITGERVNKNDLAFLGHGGLCRDCGRCLYPHCFFGKGV